MSYGTYPAFLRDCELVYNHLAQLRRTLPQDELIDRFRALFIIGLDYPEPEVAAIVSRIVTAPWADEEFDHVLNRCCYVLINYWWSNSGLKQGTVKLVKLFEALPAFEVVAPAVRKLRGRVKHFLQTDQFATIQDRARAVEQENASEYSEKKTVREHIARYPFLYPHLLMHWDQSEEGYHAVRMLQSQQEQEFEADLHRYCVASWRSRTTTTPVPPTVKNPTLLNNTELTQTIQIYTGKVHQNHTYQELADQARVKMMRAQSFHAAKQHLHAYLTTTIDPHYREHRFDRWLDGQLLNTQPEKNARPPQCTLLIQTCCELVAALLANPVHHVENHLVFMDFNHNLGPTSTVGLLLQILLLCRGFVRDQWEVIKAYVSRFFASMFKHYGAETSGQVEWLIECLENLQIAFAIHSNRTDFSWMFTA
jgi:hypothetical protein